MSDSLPPPPPRYPVSNNGFNTTTSPGMVALTPETVNVISHPTGPEYQLVVGEGVPLFFRRLIDMLMWGSRHVCASRRFIPGDTASSAFRYPGREPESAGNDTGPPDIRGQTIRLDCEPT